MIVNGDPLSVDILADKSLLALLDYFKLAKTRVAVELNGQVVKKSEYENIKINNNDVIEIIHFVGGGM